MTTAATVTRCPDCGAATQQVRPGPSPLCRECDPTAKVLVERREKDRTVASMHAARQPRGRR